MALLEKENPGPGGIWNPKMIPNRDSKAPTAYTKNQQKQETDRPKTKKAKNDTLQLVYNLIILIIVVNAMMPCCSIEDDSIMIVREDRAAKLTVEPITKIDG